MESLVEAESPSLPVARSRSPLLSVLLSTIWPGLGHLYLGRRVAAAIFAVPILALVAWILVEASQGGAGVAGDMLNEDFALALTVVVLVAGLWRGLAMVHSMVTARPVRRWGARSSALLAVLLIVMSAVHIRAAAYPWSAYNFDRTVAVAEETPTPEPTATETPSPTPTPSWGSWQWAETLGPSITPMPTPTPQIVNKYRITFLVTGRDRSSSRTDTIMLVSFDTRAHKVWMVSVPRDTAMFDYYWGGTAPATVRINTFYARVHSGLIKAPDTPWEAFKKEIGYLVGIKVDYYVAIDLDGFPGLVDLVGGVDVVNPKAINDPFSNTILPAGPLHMDGVTALHYVRSRHGAGDSDYTRSARQQDVLVALERKIVSPEMALKIPELLDATSKVVHTDFPLKKAKGYLTAASKVTDKGIFKCVLGPPYNWHPDSRETSGSSTVRLKMPLVANLSVYYFGKESRYYDYLDLVPAPCQRR
jgi:LCP family protein required for cell wall assembly